MEIKKHDVITTKDKPTKDYCKVKLILEGGISQDLVTDSHKNLCAELVCSICLEIVRFPKLCKSCQNMFCTDCLSRQLSKSKFCPNRCLYKEQEVNLIFKKLLHKIELKCYYWKSGCKETILYENFDKHTEACTWGDYKCLSPGCTVIANLRDIKQHIVDCLLKLVICDCCRGQISKAEFDKHYNECSNRQVVCEYCKKLITNKVFLKHNSECEEFIIQCKDCEKTFPRRAFQNHTETVCLKYQVEFWKNKYERSESEKHELNQRLKITNSTYMDKFLHSQPLSSSFNLNSNPNNLTLFNRFFNNNNNQSQYPNILNREIIENDGDYAYDSSINFETNQQNVIHDMEYL